MHLVPNTLDVLAPGPPAPLEAVLPLGVIRVAARLEHWLAENAKTTRAFLKRVDAVVPLGRPIQAIAIVELPRAPKGAGNRTASFDASAALARFGPGELLLLPPRDLRPVLAQWRVHPGIGDGS